MGFEVNDLSSGQVLVRHKTVHSCIDSSNVITQRSAQCHWQRELVFSKDRTATLPICNKALCRKLNGKVHVTTFQSEMALFKAKIQVIKRAFLPLCSCCRNARTVRVAHQKTPRLGPLLVLPTVLTFAHLGLYLLHASCA